MMFRNHIVVVRQDRTFRKSLVAVMVALALADSAAPVHAQAASAEPARAGGSLEEVVVTAQFRKENLQETPLAITAVTGEMLRQRNVGNITDIARSAPNVTMEQGAGVRSGGQIYIRGVGQNDFNLALEPGVGVYVDDVYFGTTYGSAFDLLDVDRAEILRGPQGTLAGGNSIGGAVKLFSQKPMGNDSGYLEVGYGSNNRFDFRGAYDFALVPDSLFMRVSGGMRSDNGYVDRLDFACANPDPAVSGRLPRQTQQPDSCVIGHEGGRDVRSGRVALRWLATNDLEFNLIGDITLDNSQPAADVPIAYPAPGVLGSGTSPDYLAQQQALYGVTLDGRFIPTSHYTTYATFSDLPNRGWTPDPDPSSTNKGVSLTANWNLGNDLVLTSITGYRSVDGEFTADVDASPLNQNTEFFHITHRQFTQELRLNGKAFGSFADWTVGGFYYDANDRSRGTVDVAGSVPLFGGLYFQQNDPVDNTDYAGFGTAVLHLTDKLNLTGGYRYTHGKKEYTFFRFDPNPAGAIYRLGIDKLGKAPPSEFSRSDYRVSLDYQWTGNFQTYVSFATGFKGGGINPRPSTPAQATPFKPETLDAWEFGAKSEWFGRRLRANAAVFLSKYEDLQVSARSVNAQGVLQTVFTNAGKATIKGAELELEAEPIDGLTFNAAVSYIHFKYDTLGIAAGFPGGPTLSSVAVMTPPWKMNVGVQYTWDLGTLGSLTPRIDADRQSKMYSDPSNREVSAIPQRTIANARVTWKSASAPEWELALQATNLFDKYYYVTVNDFIGSSGEATAQPGRSREYLLSLRRKF